MKIFRKNKSSIYLNNLDRDIIKNIIGESLLEKLQDNQFNTKLKISNSNEDIFVIKYSWVKYLKDLLANEIEYIFDKNLFLQSLSSSNISQSIQEDLKRYLQDIESFYDKGNLRRVKKNIERVLFYKNEIEELSIKIILDSSNNNILNEYKKNLNSEEFYEFLNNLVDNNLEILEIKTSRIPAEYTISFGENIEGGENYNNLSDLLSNNLNSTTTSITPVDNIKIESLELEAENKDILFIDDSPFNSFKEKMKVYNKINLVDNKVLNKYFIFLKDYLLSSDTNLYTEDWPIISKNLKNEKDWTCSFCNYQAKNEFDKQNIHVHHKDRNPKNNDKENLVVLCANCHSKQEGSGHNLITWKHEIIN